MMPGKRRTTVHITDGHCERCGGLTPLVCGYCTLLGVTAHVCSSTACLNTHQAETGCTREKP